MPEASYPKIAQYRDPSALRARLDELACALPVDEHIMTSADGSPLASPLAFGDRTLGNRWCIHPMEGWDANADGSPSEHTLRRWRAFGQSGAKLIWGGEAAAVRPDGRANPHQTLATRENRAGLAALLEALLQAHREHVGETDQLVVGLVQANVDLFDKWDVAKRDSTFVPYTRGTEAVSAEGARLTVWAETALTFDQRSRRTEYERLARLARETGSYILTGYVERQIDDE